MANYKVFLKSIFLSVVCITDFCVAISFCNVLDIVLFFFKIMKSLYRHNCLNCLVGYVSFKKGMNNILNFYVCNLLLLECNFFSHQIFGLSIVLYHRPKNSILFIIL